MRGEKNKRMKVRRRKKRTIKYISNGFLDYPYSLISHYEFNEILPMDVDCYIFYGNCGVLTSLLWLAYKSFFYRQDSLLDFPKNMLVERIFLEEGEDYAE